ncbi:MAG: hypothetical protein U1A78_02535 [Polyangia bacterium]
MRLLRCGLLLLLAGCEARFVDLRVNQGPGPAAPLPDLAGIDLAGTGAVEKLLAKGPFTGRAGHAGAGTSQLVRRADGAVEGRFAADFSASNVPGPAVFLTSRTDMGTTLDPVADVNLGTLKAPAGSQVYAVPAGAEEGRRNVFIYCQPFRVEVAKAALVDEP